MRRAPIIPKGEVDEARKARDILLGIVSRLEHVYGLGVDPWKAGTLDRIIARLERWGGFQ